MRSPETGSPPGEGHCRKPGAVFLGLARLYHGLPVCSESSPSVELQSSVPGSQFLDHAYGALAADAVTKLESIREDAESGPWADCGINRFHDFRLKRARGLGDLAIRRAQSAAPFCGAQSGPALLCSPRLFSALRESSKDSEDASKLLT